MFKAGQAGILGQARFTQMMRLYRTFDITLG